MDAKLKAELERRTNEAFVGALYNLGGYTRGHVSTACVKMIAAMFIVKEAPATDERIDQICREAAAMLRAEILSGMTAAAVLGKNQALACVGLEELEQEDAAP